MTQSHIPVNKIFVLEKKISSFLKSETEKFRPILVHVYYFLLSVKVCLAAQFLKTVLTEHRNAVYSITIEENNQMDNQISTRLSMQTKQLCIVCIHALHVDICEYF